jgi:hypothetical protein
LIGVATAAVWFVLSHAASAEQICQQICDNGSCISRCVDRQNSQVIIREHDDDYYRDHERGHAPGVGVEIGR